MHLITASRSKDMQTCMRLHNFKYEQGYRPLETEVAPLFGKVLHLSLDAWWRAFMEGVGHKALELAQRPITEAIGTLEDQWIAKARVLITGYHLRWAPSMADLEVLAVELEFRAPIMGPDGRVLEGEVLAGKIDKIVRKRQDGSIWTVEHKTSGADLTPGATYWQKLRMDQQVSLYFDGAAAHGYQIAGCIYDVIAKPDQRLLKATSLDKRKFTVGGRLYANQRLEDETIDEFTERIAGLVAEAPEGYFQRAEVVRLEQELEAARRDLYETAALMRHARENGLAPRSPDRCHSMYGRNCPFLDVCSGVASLDDETRFQKLKFPHPELKDFAERGGR